MKIESSEATQATIRNLRAVEKFLELLGDSVQSMLLSGSTVYGPFYAVNAKSDIDSLVTADNIESLGTIISRCVAAGIYESSVEKRFKVFKELYKEKRVETFSVRTIFMGVEMETDFIPMDVINDICNLNPIRTRTYSDGFCCVDIRVVNEFRKKIPPHQDIGETADDLRGKRKIVFKSK